MKSDDIQSRRFVLDTRSSGELRMAFKQDSPEALQKAAREFESMLLQMMLKSMREATPQNGPLDSDQTRFFTSVLDQQMASDLGRRGSLGFAKLIEQQLGRHLKAGDDAAAGAANALESLQRAMLERQAASSAALAEGGALRLGARAQGATSGVAQSAEVMAPEGSGGRDFVNRVWPHAVEAANRLGVPAHFLVAHSALESGWGKSEIRAADGTPTYNIFGVKAGKGWRGASVEVATTEYVDGVAQSTRERFRAYRSYGEAFHDYADLLANNPRFAGVLGQREGADFARSLQQSGYATDPLYAAKLDRIINGTTLRQALLG